MAAEVCEGNPERFRLLVCVRQSSSAPGSDGDSVSVSVSANATQPRTVIGKSTIGPSTNGGDEGDEGDEGFEGWLDFTAIRPQDPRDWLTALRTQRGFQQAEEGGDHSSGDEGDGEPEAKGVELAKQLAKERMSQQKSQQAHPVGRYAHVKGPGGSAGPVGVRGSGGYGPGQYLKKGDGQARGRSPSVKPVQSGKGAPTILSVNNNSARSPR